MATKPVLYDAQWLMRFLKALLDASYNVIKHYNDVFIDVTTKEHCTLILSA